MTLDIDDASLPEGTELVVTHSDGALNLALRSTAEVMPPVRPSGPLLERVAAAFRGEKQVHSNVLCARLAEDYPGLYEDWESTDLALALRRFGISSDQIWAPRLEGGQPTNRKGFHRQHILDKLAEQEAMT